MRRKNHCKIKVVLIDFDGTVVNTMHLLAEKASELISRGIKIDRMKAKELYLSLVGRPFREQLQILGVKNPEQLESLAKEFENFKKNLLRNMELDRNVKKKIRLLKEQGFKVLLSTNSECNVVKSNNYLIEIFDKILCHDPKTGERKGKPHLDKIIEFYGVEPCEVVFIGDSEYDINLYSSLGVITYRTKGLWNLKDNAVDKLIEEVKKCEGKQ